MPHEAAATASTVVGFTGTSWDDGTAGERRSVPEVAALEVLAVEREDEVERVHVGNRTDRAASS